MKRLKKLIVLGITLALLFSLAACNEAVRNAENIAQYKVDGKRSINEHVAAKEQDDYTVDGWITILKTSADGKEAIDMATNKVDVDDVVADTIMEIDNVEPKGEIPLEGAFFELQEACNEGFVTKEDIMHISFFMKGYVYKVQDGEENWDDDKNWIEVNFQPQIVMPDIGNLDAQVVNDMKQEFYELNQEYMDKSLQELKDNGYWYFGQGTTALDTIRIVFLGEYNGCYAVRITSILWSYGTALRAVKVADIIWWQSGEPVTIFKYQ